MKRMKISMWAIVMGACVLSQAAFGAGHEILHAGDQASVKGSSSIFTGNVRQDPIARADENSHNSITVVTFEPGARTFWHTHPAGQRLLVVSGKGLVGTADGRTDVVRAGDYIWCPPAVKHWHGATPETAMSHIALTNVKDGKSVDWLEAVSDEQYREASSRAIDPMKD